MKISCRLQGIPNPEKPGITIVDCGTVVRYDNVIETNNGTFVLDHDDPVTIEKAKVLRGFSSDVLSKMGYHIIETTTIASGKKSYALIKKGPLKALLKKHQEFINSSVIQ